MSSNVPRIEPMPEMPNQTAKQDDGKPQYTLVPTGIIKAVEKIRAYGNAKYHDPQNWKSVESQRFWDAAVRHMVAARDDYTAIDDESRLPHLWPVEVQPRISSPNLIPLRNSSASS